MMIEGFNPGGFTSNSNVFVAGGYMYFQGTDHAVWRVSTTGPINDNNNFGGPSVIKTLSNTVFAVDGFMYFRGTDDKVWKMSISKPYDPINIGGFKTNSDVFVAGGYLYFQGTDHAVWRVSISDPTNDRNNFGGPKVIKAKSNIYFLNGFMYFRGTDNKVWQMGISEPYNPINIGGFKTNSDVFIADGYMYFQGTDHAVWRVSISDPTNDRNNFGGPNVIKTQSNVYAADGYMYFQGTDNKVWQMSITQPYSPVNIGALKTQSDVFCANNSLYFQGVDHKVWCFDFNDGTLEQYATVAVDALQGWYNWNGNGFQLGQAFGEHAGQWNSTGWWNSANSLYALIDYMAASINRGYMSVMGNTFDKCKSGNFLNDYYDDEGWWALTWINAHDLSNGDQQYLTMAQTIFSDMTGGWDEICHGGIYWKKDHTDGHGHKPYKNAVANELFLSIAVRLYQRSMSPAEQQGYKTWIEKTASWFAASTLINSSNLINDGLTTKCVNDGGATFSYTQGVILGALVDMHTSGLTFAGKAPLAVAEQIANAAIAPLSPLSKDGILIEYGDPTPGKDVGPDKAQFKGIFIRNLALLAIYADRATATNYIAFIRDNVRSILANDRNSVNQFGYAWAGPFDQQDAARQTSALEALNAARKVGIQNL